MIYFTHIFKKHGYPAVDGKRSRKKTIFLNTIGKKIVHKEGFPGFIRKFPNLIAYLTKRALRRLIGVYVQLFRPRETSLVF